MSAVRGSWLAGFFTPAAKLGITSLAPGHKKGAVLSSATAAALESSTLESLLSRALASSPDAIILSGACRRLLVANAAAADLFGYSGAEMSGLSMRELYGPDEDWNTARLALAHATPQAAPVEVTLRKQSGTLFDATVSARAINDDAGAPIGFIETFRNSSADTRTASNAEEIFANNDSVRLARGIAHDFNNILAIIGGNVQLARERTEDKTTVRFLAEAEQACAMGARMTQRIMTFAEGRHFAPTAIDVAAMLSRQAPLVHSILGAGITLEIEAQPEMPPVFADLSGLENAILNLALNARDAMPGGGQLLIRATRLEASREIKIDVQDTGTGMTPHIKARAFEPFFTTKDPGRGTGLGLASVYGFAKQSGGRAEIDSTLGNGITISLYLPVATKHAASR
jgi:PAS domain S-box-containing protein